MKQLPLPIVAPATARFETFMPGANAAVLQHLAQVGSSATPVYLWGPSGSGKTHLLRALAEVRQERGERVGWYDAASRAPWHLEPGAALLLLDGCDRYDDAQQLAAFSLLVEAQAHGVPWVAAARVPAVFMNNRGGSRRNGWGNTMRWYAHVFVVSRDVVLGVHRLFGFVCRGARLQFLTRCTETNLSSLLS